VEVITVDAVVLDGDGRPVRGLTRADFRLFEDGRAQEIASFEAFDDAEGGASVEARPVSAPAVATARPPSRGGARTFVIVVDDMGLAPSRQADVRSALARFLSGLRDGDELIVATTSHDTWWTARLPEGREDLAALFARVRGRGLRDSFADAISEWEAYRIANVEGTSFARVEAMPGEKGGFAPGQNVTARVVQRYLERRVCDPLAPGLCDAMVRARAKQVDQRRLNRTRDVLHTIDRATFALTGARGRKSLLLLTEGFLNDPAVSAVQEVAGKAREANLVVYSLDVRGLVAATSGELAESGSLSGGPGELALLRAEAIDFEAAGNAGLAEDTGGFAVRNTNDLAGEAARVAEESRVYYLLGFAPPPGKGPRDWRKLKVEVTRPGLTVRARKGYLRRSAAEVAAGLPSPVPDDPGRAARLPTDVARALSSGRDVADLPLRAMAHVLEERPEGVVRVLVTMEADVRQLANLGGGDAPRAVVSLSIAATHRDTGKTTSLAERLVAETGPDAEDERWLGVTRELLLPPGVAQARVVVRDEFLGRTGALTLRLEVPAPGSLRLSTPVLSDRLRRPRDQAAPQVALVARREFAGSGNLYCQFQVFGAKTAGGGPRVVASFELRRAGGGSVRRSEPTPIEPTPEGRLVRLLAFPLSEQEAGEYELVLRVVDQASGESREVSERIWVMKRG
jgi:VWFA-related protein